MFSATHRAHRDGAPTWPVADPSSPAGPRLDPRLEVQVLEAHANWARIRCSNGWETWTDERWLEPLAVAPAAPVRVPRPGPVPAATRVQPAEMAALAGAVLGLIGALLPWFTTPTASLSGFDLSMWGLLTARSTQVAPTAGLVAVIGSVGGGLLVVVACFRAVPGWAFTLAGAAVFNAGVVALGRWSQSPEPRPGIGSGVVLVLIGGTIALTAGWLMLAQRRRA